MTAMETVQWFTSVASGVFESSIQSSIPRARVLIDRGEWGRFKNENLSKQLSLLRDTTYDAEDLLREFGDHLLQQRMEEANRSRAGQLLYSTFTHFKNWIRRSKTRVMEAQSNLNKVVTDTEAILNFLRLNVEPVQLMPHTSAIISAPEVFGRDKERDLVIKMLGVMSGRDKERDQLIKLLVVPLAKHSISVGADGKRLALDTDVTSSSRAKRLKGKSVIVTSARCASKVHVLAVVGIGGVGKTTLAQFIYNDERVEEHFDLRIWVCVSDLFDKVRITKEIIESIPDVEFSASSSLNYLQGELMKQLAGRKFLLVLDDVWTDDSVEWEALCAPFRQGVEGSMVLVTTRFPKVAKLVTSIKPIQLEGLPTDIFWEFFKKCAFGDEHPECYPQLQEIGQKIISRLCRSPLAAKTLGRLLNSNLTEQHWRSIQNSELWELPHQANDILPALRLSYLYLPPELKRCFAICSMFPKDYPFKREEIVEFWVAHGLVAPRGSMRLEDIGNRYLDELRNLFLFQSDPKSHEKCVMHDLIHDMAQSVSVDECFLMEGLSYQKQRVIPQTVRHMSIGLHNDALSRMAGLSHLNKLHSLRLGLGFNGETSVFNQLSNILFLSLQGCKLLKLPESICVLNHLRYLDVSFSSIQELPEKFGCLYSLQVFDATYSKLQTVQQCVTKLVKLRRLAVPEKASSKLSTLSGLGNMSSLRNLMYFTVGTVNGRRISELRCMNQLSGTLCIRALINVQSMAEATEARLIDKQYLKELILQWGLVGCCRGDPDNEALEALRPPSGIERLKILLFTGDKFSPSWLNPEDLPNIRSLKLDQCYYLTSIYSCSGTAPLHFKSLTTLHLNSCYGLTNIDKLMSPESLPSIKCIDLQQCKSLASLPVNRFGGYICLQYLKIVGCKELVFPTEMCLPLSLQQLFICDCGELDKSLRPDCFENLSSLAILHLEWCPNIESILLNSISSNKLKSLVLRHCLELSSIGEPHDLSSIMRVDISNCPKLTEVQQPFRKICDSRRRRNG